MPATEEGDTVVQLSSLLGAVEDEAVVVEVAVAPPIVPELRLRSALPNVVPAPRGQSDVESFIGSSSDSTESVSGGNQAKPAVEGSQGDASSIVGS